MPLPIGHSLAGYMLQDSNRLSFFRKKWQTILFFVILANLPDIDFLPGFLVGNPNLYHHGIVHSLGAALLVGLAGAWYFSRSNGLFWRYFGIIAAVYYSHLILDFFSLDLREPQGVMLFWPLAETYFMSPISLFASVDKSSDSFTFFQSLMTFHNLTVALREFAIMAPLALMPYLYRKIKHKKQKAAALRFTLQNRSQGQAAWQVQPVQKTDDISTFTK